MPHLDDMHCKHCGAIIAFIRRASLKNKFGVECEVCGVVTIIWPVEPKPLALPCYTEAVEA